MAFLQELASNKEKLLKFFLSDQTLVDLLTGNENTALPNLGLRYTQVFPYHWLDNSITEQKSFLCFSVSTPRTQTQTIKDVEMKIWFFSHANIMWTPTGPRIDLLAAAVDNLLNGASGFGIGKAELLGTREITPAKDFYGYEIRYLVKDFNISFREMRLGE
jgi:hypothetical protein